MRGSYRPADGEVRALISVGVRHWPLLRELAVREIRDRYARLSLGAAWALLNPLAILALYVVLFTVVFPDRAQGDGGRAGGVLRIIAGLAPWLCIAEVVARAPTALTSHAALVKQIIFPVEVLPLKSLAPPMLAFSVLLVGFVALSLVTEPSNLARLYLLAPAMAALLTFLVGISLLLSALGVLMRDLREVVSVLVSAGLFLVPALYSDEKLASMPSPLRAIIEYNPFSQFIWCFQDALFHGAMAHPAAWIASALIASLTLWSGARVFGRLKPHFGDAL